MKDNDYFYSLDTTITYPIMGTFTEWLISTYGIEKYKCFFQQQQAVLGSSEVYQKSLEELEKQFVDYVVLFSMDEVVEKRIEELIN